MSAYAESIRVLIVDDDLISVSTLAAALRRLDFDVVTTQNKCDGLESVIAQPPDVIVIELAVVDIDPFIVFKRLRQVGAADVPVLVLSACADIQTKVRALALGAEDYVTKPFEVEEVIARIGVLLRRRRTRPNVATARLGVGPVVLDRWVRQVWLDGVPVQLSATEFDLLAYLMGNANRVITRTQILEHVWKSEHNSESRVVETYVYHLRQKLRDCDRSLIKTVRGVGYLMPTAGRR
jgi:two-component system, OmpR family, response regulator